MNTFIPRQTKLSRERIEVRLETGLIGKLDRYCEYLDSDRDYVMAQLIEVAFRKDKGFAEWFEQKTEQNLAPLTRGRRTLHGTNVPETAGEFK